MPTADPHASLASYFDDCRECWGQVADKTQDHSFTFRIAGQRVRMRFAGDELMFLTRAFGHFPTAEESGRPSGVPDTETGNSPLEILICEGAATETELPEPPWPIDAVRNHPDTKWMIDRGSVFVSHMPQHGYVIMYRPAERIALVWIQDKSQLPYWEIASPFCVVFSWWAEQIGGQIAHAATVGCDGRGVLLVGRGGSGKSTTALACVDAGLQYVSDDYVLLTDDPMPVGHCLYSTGKLHRHLLEDHFAHWQDRVAANVGLEQKAVFFLSNDCPNQISKSLELVGVVRPRFVELAESTIELSSKANVLLGLGPSTVFQHPSRRGNGLSFLAQLVRSLPSHQMNLGAIATGPTALKDLLLGSPTHVA